MPDALAGVTRHVVVGRAGVWWGSVWQAWRGNVWSVQVRQGLAGGVRYGAAGLGAAGRGKAGKVSRGKSRQGLLRQVVVRCGAFLIFS